MTEQHKPELVYSDSPDERFTDDLSDVFDRLDNADRMHAGAVYHVGEKEVHTPTSLARGTADDVIERMQSNAWEVADEFSEGYGDHVKAEAKAELEALIAGWAENHLRVDFFTVINIREATVTEQDAADYSPVLAEVRL